MAKIHVSHGTSELIFTASVDNYSVTLNLKFAVYAVTKALTSLASIGVVGCSGSFNGILLRERYKVQAPTDIGLILLLFLFLMLTDNGITIVQFLCCKCMFKFFCCKVFVLWEYYEVESTCNLYAQ